MIADANSAVESLDALPESVVHPRRAHSRGYPLFVVIPEDDVGPKFSFLGVFAGSFTDLESSVGILRDVFGSSQSYDPGNSR